MNQLPISVLIAVMNEGKNISRCLEALGPAQEIIVVDSHSTDDTVELAENSNVKVVQFDYEGGYPKKRQWTLDNIEIKTPWVLLLDADEYVPDGLWQEIGKAILGSSGCDAFMVSKGFHFLGRPMKYGGFSHSAILLFKVGKARFERLFDDVPDGLDMEVHERLIVDGQIGKLSTPLIHEDFKGLEAYIDRHNKYSSWEARLRYRFMTSGLYGEETIKPTFFGNSQERRRFLKKIIIRVPFESWLWFFYHYIFRLGFIHGRRGLIACRIRARYIEEVRAKIYEIVSRS